MYNNFINTDLVSYEEEELNIFYVDNKEVSYNTLSIGTHFNAEDQDGNPIEDEDGNTDFVVTGPIGQNECGHYIPCAPIGSI